MAYYSSDQLWELINTHPNSIESLTPSSLVLPSDCGPKASLQAALPLDTTWATIGSDPTYHTLFAETPVFENYSQRHGPVQFLNRYPSSGFFSQDFCCAAPLAYPANCESSEQAISETSLLLSAQSNLHQLSTPLNSPLEPCSQGWRHDLSFLPRDVEWVIRQRLQRIEWALIREHYKALWKDVSESNFCNKMQRMRDKYRIINHILPSRQQFSRQPPSMICKCPMGCWYYV